MLGPCLLFALALFLARGGSTASNLFANLPAGRKDDPLEGYPHRFRENRNDWSFAGHTQMNVRLPYGPNPEAPKRIADQSFFNDKRYMDKYQANLKRTWIDNQDWRLDPTTGHNSPYINPAGNPHIPEKNLDKLKNFSNSESCPYPYSNKLY